MDDRQNEEELLNMIDEGTGGSYYDGSEYLNLSGGDDGGDDSGDDSGDDGADHGGDHGEDTIIITNSVEVYKASIDRSLV